MKKLISSILMVTGTTIGGGMIMLPAIIGIYSYYSAIGILVSVWLMNVMIALIFLEANCYLPVRTSIISMSKRLLGNYGKWIAWILCLIFLYTIMSAYTTGMTEVISGLLEKKHIYVAASCISVLSVIIIGVPIYFGISYVNKFNQFLTIGMFVAFFGLIYFITPQISIDNLWLLPMHLPFPALPIVFTSFGFLIIIPTLRAYLNDDIRHLKIAIIIGSLIPLIIYLLWVTLVMGAIPAIGHDGLADILAQGQPIKKLTNVLIANTGQLQISWIIQLFILFAIASSFIGTSLGLYDFLADGLTLTEHFTSKMILLTLTFIPPLMIVLSKTHLFLTALGIAGLLSIILFGIYPVLLAWAGRFVHKLTTSYRVGVSSYFFFLIIIFSFIVIAAEILVLK